MTVVGNPSHAMFFNGISDAVIVPNAAYTASGETLKTGQKSFGNIHSVQLREGTLLPTLPLDAFTLEAWVIPDQGGTIIEYENLFRLSLGKVSAAGPAQFSVRLNNAIGGGQEDVVITSATPVKDKSGNLSYWDGTVYPRSAIDAHDSYDPLVTAKDDVTALNLGHRELMQVTVTFDGLRISLKVNGDVVAIRELRERHHLRMGEGRIFFGGRGGEFRGVIEAVHWSRGASQTASAPYAPVKSDATLGLWRFEEPVEPVSTIIDLPALTASTSASVISVGTTVAQTLVDTITGKSGQTSVNLEASPYSNGNYKTARYQSGSNTTVNIPHVPFNLLINPLGYSTSTGRTNGEPPERVRITAVDSSAGTMTVESIHLDYVSQPANGRRGLLHTRASASKAVLVSGDCLVDAGTGEPYQPEGTATQFAYRAGQVLIDESDNNNHGIVFNLTMASDQTDNFNKFAVNFGSVDTKFKIGHTGRHTLNHVDGHPFMGVLPPPTQETLVQKSDGISDVFSVVFPDQYSDVRNQVAINSQTTLYDEKRPQAVREVVSTGVAFQAVENGMAGIDDTKRGLLAIGGAGVKTDESATAFNPLPFALKSTNGEIPETDTDQYRRHLAPVSNSRIAILEVPSLAAEGYAPFVQVYYNAIDFSGETIRYAASARLTTGISGGGTVLTCQSVKAFGKDSQVLKGTDISIGGTAAFEAGSNATATLSHSAGTITFSTVADAAFQTAAVTDAVVQLTLQGPVLLVEKTVPDVSTAVSGGNRIIDLIQTDLNTAGTSTPIHSPGGIITIHPESSFDINDGELGGDDTGGVDYESLLDQSLTPENYMPFHSTDDAQKAPQGVASANVNDSTHPSVFHKLIVKPTIQESGDPKQDDTGIYREKEKGGATIRTKVFVDGAHSSGATTVNIRGAAASTFFKTSMKVYLATGVEIGSVTSVTGKTIGFSAGTLVALGDGDEVLLRGKHQTIQSTNQSTGVHEVYDIIDNVHIGGLVHLYVQPSDRRRHSQLSRLFTRDIPQVRPNQVSVAYLMARGRVLSFSDDNKRGLEMRCHGLTSDIAGSLVDVSGAGAPDSHIVKEIMPGAPVVTVTLGGPGQGAVNTKETWDPSPLARLGWSTRRDCVTKVSSITSGSGFVDVVPLNNSSTALTSWGTYCFPKTGRIYLEMPRNSPTEPARFASAAYTSKTGTRFTCTTATGRQGTGDFVLADGSESDSFAAWVTATGINTSSVLHVDNLANDESLCNDGTTVNDRLFQTLSSVQHDYQLGTQYASTRAMVEIPLFEEFFFDDPERGIFPGPDNSMKLHVDATFTAANWAPNPVGRRGDDLSPQDPEVFSAFSYTVAQNKHRRGTVITQPYDAANRRINIKEVDMFPIPSITAISVAGIGNSLRYRKAYLPSGEWVMYESKGADYLQVAGGGSAAADGFAFSSNFLRELRVGGTIIPAPGSQEMNLSPIADNPLLASAGFEGRRPYYYDRANVMTQGGNVDYGMKQYVSAIEFRAGPRHNPHLERIKPGRARGIVESWSSPSLVLVDGSDFPEDLTAVTSSYKYRLAYYDTTAAAYKFAHYVKRTNNDMSLTDIDAGWAPSAGDEIILWDAHSTTGAYPQVSEEYFLNKAWGNPYAPGGMRDGDTIWANMHYTNPHATEGLFAKSRAVLNEALVWSGFSGGEGAFSANPRDSIPMENFLIGKTCVETAQNYVQHVNRTIELNYEALGLSPTSAPTVAYIDPYQSTEEFARVLLYDVAHDREFIAFQDLWMQVQSSPEAVSIGKDPASSTGVIDNQIANSGSWLDVEAGFNSQSKFLTSTTKSDFIEAAMSHNSTWNANHASHYHEHSPDVEGCMTSGSPPRTNDAVVCPSVAENKHKEINKDERENSTFFDTPDGTRAIPAFLALKGIRATNLGLTTHEEDRLQHLKHWTNMDFVRRLTVDCGEVGVKEGVTDIEAAAREVVRLINQAGAKNGRSHARRPTDQFLGESERFDLTSVGVKADSTNRNKDPTAPHQHADFAATGSTHDPAPFWDIERAFSSHDRGTHMGYVRAHLGRVVLDSDGRRGFSIIIHSTVPGASGRNFCTWLDNSRGQVPYKPQYLIGHGGRFRNYWCQPDEITGENMHPAPMPINRHGRPFAPITTLKEYLPPEEVDEPLRNNLEFGPDYTGTSTHNATSTREGASGRNSNTVQNESFETKSPSSVLIDGLRVGTHARGRINFGGFAKAGFPGWAPDAGKWGYGRDLQDERFNHIYGKVSGLSESSMFGVSDAASGGYIPDIDIRPDQIGDGQLYGVRFVDHRGGTHTVRMVYREFGQPFANDKSTLPPTIDEEIVIYFDDRDCGQGGFTIGKHMVGKGDVCGEFTAGTLNSYKGNKWNAYPAPAVGVSVTPTITGSDPYTLEVVLDAPYDNAGGFTHPDILGYLGFPESGIIQLNNVAGAGANGLTLSYTSRSHFDKAGGTSNKHFFYGLEGSTSITGTHIMSPRINWTSLLTDEVIAAAVEFALKMDDPNSDDLKATSFDCTGMLASDGKTLGEWGVSPTAIRVKAHSDKHKIQPLKHLFDVTRNKDWGLQEGASSDTVVASHHTGGLSNSERDNGTRLDVGYIPENVLHITTKYRGSNANTATPVLVDTMNNVVDEVVWRQNLRGERFTRVAGDHILPYVDNPMVKLDDANINTGTQSLPLATGTQMFLFAAPACTDTNSWGERVTMWVDDLDWAVVRSKPGATSSNELTYNTAEISSGFTGKVQPGVDPVYGRYSQVGLGFKVDGIRRAGSKKSSPFLYFRGGRDSPDHWVPLYFGGGFSGVTMDINDGTQNDYADFYTHPYAAGPTGAAGLQNVGEVSGSFALIDTNAMMAMFPGTAYLDQHKGMGHMPFFNHDAMLSFDLDAGRDQSGGDISTSFTGVDYTDGTTTVRCQRPSPVILRFAHPHARYSPTGSTTNQTTYIVFGPGQAIPHNFASFEPQLKNIIEGGNGYSKTPRSNTSGDSFLPNQIAHGGSQRSGFNAYLPPTMEFQINNVLGYNYVMNWDPAQGRPNENSSPTKSYAQTEVQGLYYNDHFTGASPPIYAHAFTTVFSDVSGNAIGSSALPTTRGASVLWHMDGGYHPGGHFLDNHVTRNPKHPISNTRFATGGTNQHNVTSFRVAAQLAEAYLKTYASETDMVGSHDYIVVDATRCQNAEELGAVLSASINTFPGQDPLKAIGGTFLPSFQSSSGQDKYGWVEMDLATNGYTEESAGPTAATIQVSASLPTTLPNYGWVRMSNGTNAAFASYVSYSGSTLTLGTNPFATVTPKTNAVDPETKTDANAANFTNDTTKVYIWTKAGTHRYNNKAADTTRDHMCQVHFNGLMDAVDRTKPAGAVGWHGEAYSMLNSYNGSTLGSTYPSGKGAWHPFLGFSPYGAAEMCVSNPITTGSTDVPAAVQNLECTTGLSSRHLVAVTHESEAPLIAKADRDGILANGDWLMAKSTTTLTNAGTTKWDTAKVHNKSRYVGPATGGPNVEAMMVSASTFPRASGDYPSVGTEAYWHAQVTNNNQLALATPCQSPTGDLFWDVSVNPAAYFHEDQSTKVKFCNGTNGVEADQADGGIFGFYNTRAAARNFNIEHVVWKRMDGGNLTLPAPNARGLGMTPWVVRKDGASYKTVGEKVLGNNRFSFETTNAAMFPIIQAQELAHPQLAERHPFEVRNALAIPNEEMQFLDLEVLDDTGQTHTLVGGSPLGTVVLDFRHVSDREVEGLAPALAGSGLSPNMKIRLPNPDEIPGNIIVRSGFDRIQGYQNETMGSGGLQHPLQPMTMVKDMFDLKNPGPRLWPTWEDNGWEHISQEATDVSLTTSKTRLAFPDSTNLGWEEHTDNAPIQTAYEPHDRTLYFHVTRMGHSMTHRFDVDELTFSSHATTANTITATTAPEAATWQDSSEQSSSRWFVRVYDPTTDQGVVASYTGVSGSNLTGVVFDADFDTFVTGKTGLKMVPSYYVPAGSNRFFAARRLRDHSEYSGNSPDMQTLDWAGIDSGPFDELTKPRMTPMPVPRMGHHYVTPTMAMLPGHYAHPLYQRLYDLHYACRASQNAALEDAGYNPGTNILNSVPGRDPLVWFSGPTAAFAPSDVHGGAFTLLTETKVKFEGYGIAASKGAAGTTNSQGGHSVVMEAAGAYTLKGHFPDPMEVGAYQIVIQPNTFKQQLSGFHRNHSEETKGPAESGTLVTELTGQQVNTVIAIEHDSGSTNGSYTLVLAEATMADVRGCEVIINEVMLDMEPDVASQFANIPTLGLSNPLGVNETTAPALSRRSLPYRPNAFIQSTPGYTVTTPWWAQLHKDGARSAAATKWLQLEWLKPDNYHEVSRSTFGAVGGQITLGGYPSSYIDLYEEHQRLRSLTPNAVVISKTDPIGNPATTPGSIVVDNNDLFPVVPYYGEVLEYVDSNGLRHTATYTNRTGTLTYPTLGASTTFSGVSGVASDRFWTGLSTGAVLRLSGPFDDWKAGDAYKNSERGLATRTLPQTLHGTRDTNSLHSPDAFLCLWHPNLGRPFTWYSDDASRTFYDKNGNADAPVLKKALNMVPEHFETIHYHDFFYAASKGPFAFGMQWLSPPGSAGLSADGTVYTATVIDADANLSNQGGTDGSNKYNFAGFWPGGSRGGAGASRLDGFGSALIGWGNKSFDIDCVGFRDNSGVEERTYAQMTSDSEFARQHCFGYRFALRQPQNRPRWSPVIRGYLELANANAMLGYYAGALVQQDGKTNGWSYVGADTNQSSVDFTATYVGILERLTQVTALLNEDQLGRQVRYSDGRRMTRAFGCPVRTLRNPSTVRRLYPGDDSGKEIRELAEAHRYYMIDWWGNTRGEDVRRFPARGFGIRPAWDPEDAYDDAGNTNRPGNVDLWAGDLTDVQTGHANTTNNDVTAMATVDWFNPKNQMRIGDRGDGRGVRWPTVFNESLLHDISAPMAATGLLLSHSTAEPNFGQGLIRPRNDDLQNTEVKRGISSRLGVSDGDGLLKPEANVGEGVENVSGTFTLGNEVLADPVARSGPRIGLDADTISELNEGVQRDYVGIATQAYSLHTDTEVGQRTNLRGALNVASRTLTDLDLTALDWSAQPKAGVVRMSNAHAMWALGGTYVLEARNYAETFDDKNWGNASGTNSSNPYQDSNHKPKVGKTNTKDKVVRFLMRPARVLDSRHFSLFRHAPAVKSGAPQVGADFYRATSGGKYGMFNYDAPNARTGTVGPTNPPYSPVYYVDPTGSTTTPSSDGPKIPGADVTGFDKTSIRQTTGRMVMSENTLEHFRSDAPRRRASEEDGKESRADYSVQPRYSQNLHPKGEGGTSNFNTGDHSGE